MFSETRKAVRSLVRQRDEADCGAACLATVVGYYGGSVQVEHLRAVSGTSAQGTTLLGLFQAAGEVGFEAKAFRMDLDHLRSVRMPCILHVVKNGRLQHFVVCFGFREGGVLIGDPAGGVVEWSEKELSAHWTSGAVLVLTPADSFRGADRLRRERWTWIRRLVKEDVELLTAVLFLGICVTVLSLSTALFSQTLIDDILPSGDASRLSLGLGLLLFLLLGRGALYYVRQLLLLKQARQFNNRIIGYFYETLLRLPAAFFRHRKVGDLVARMNDTGRIQRALAYLFGNVMIDVLLVVVVVAFIFSYSFELGAMALVALPAAGLLASRYHRPILMGQREAMAAHAANESNYVDTIQGIDAIKTGGREDVFAQSTKAVYGYFQDRIFDLGRIGVGFQLWSDVCGVALMVGVIAWSSFMVLHETLRLGEMIAVLQMVGAYMPAVVRLAVVNVQLQEARVAFDRMFDFTLLEPESTPEAEAARSEPAELHSLEVDQLTFRFPGRKPLLKDASFAVRRGEWIALVGESGCGKSTLLHLLLKFYKPECGCILVDGRELEDVRTDAWRRLVAVVPQEIKLFNDTLAANICLSSRQEDAAAAVDICRAYGFDAYFARLPQGYATLVGENGTVLSGGQRQLVALARALCRRPQLLLLDEVTSAMDRRTEAFVLDLLHRLREHLGIVFVTHRASAATRADRIYVLEDGATREAFPKEKQLERDLLDEVTVASSHPFSPQYLTSRFT